MSPVAAAVTRSRATPAASPAVATQTRTTSSAGAMQNVATPAVTVSPATRQSNVAQTGPALSNVSPPPAPERSGTIQKVLDKFADWSGNIPGFRMLTIVLGFNPINFRAVSRSAPNLLRALIEMVPGGGIITTVLDSHGLIEQVAAWAARQIATLGDIGGEILGGLNRFIDTLGWSDLAPWNWGDVWDRAKQIFTTPITRLISFGVNVATDILQMVKQMILLPLAALAKDTRGYDLLKAVLGEDPITGEKVPRNAETLIGGFMKFIGQEEIWQNIKRGNAVARAWTWFQGALAGLMGLVRSVPKKIIATLSTLTFVDIVTIAGAFIKIAGAFISVAAEFILWGLGTSWSLLEIIFDVVKPGIMGYIKRTGAALKSIIKNPLPFVGNLVKAAKLGFENFASHFGTHLKNGLIDWLTGSLEGVYIPTALSLPEMGKFAMSVLGVSWAQIRGKIVKVLGPAGETIMKGMETGFDIIVALVKGGPAAAWELIKEKLTDLKDQVVSGIVGFVTETVITKAVPKLIAMFIPGAGFITAIISIYDTVMVFVQKISKIIQVVTAFIDSIVAIAGGNITAAANRVEKILAGLLSLSISFLAGFLGLGKVTDKIKSVIEKIRTKVDTAIDKVIAWIVEKAKAVFGKLSGKKQDDQRTLEQKQADLNKAMAEAEILRSKPGITEAEIVKGLKPIKQKYKMVSLALVVDAQGETDETVHVEGEINPKGKSLPEKINKNSGKTESDAIEFKWVKPKVSGYPKISIIQSGNRVAVGPHDRPVVGGLQLGVTYSDALNIGPNKTLQLKKKVTSNSVKDNMNKILKANGYDRSQGDPSPRDTDHIVEKQLGGPDELCNLWPLKESTNRESGGRVRAQIAEIKKATKRSTVDGLWIKFKF